MVDPIDWSHPPLSYAVPPELHVLHVQIARLAAPAGTRTYCQWNARPMHWLCGNSMYYINIEKFISQYEHSEQSQSSVSRAVIGRGFCLSQVYRSNFSNQIFRKDFVCIHYHLCEILNELKLTIMIFISIDLIIIYKLINLKIIWLIMKMRRSQQVWSDLTRIKQRVSLSSS